MNGNKRFKVLAIMSKSDGSGEYFTRVGNAFANKDASINVYMDLLPLSTGGKQVKLQIRELDEKDLAQREAYRSRSSGDPLGSRAAVTSVASESDVPF